MKKYKSVTMCILVSWSLSCQAKTLADAEDMKIFDTTNYCQGCDLSGTSIVTDHDYGFLLNSYAIRTVFEGSLYKMNFSGSIMPYSKFTTSNNHYKTAQESIFERVNLSYSSIKRVDLSNSNFSDVNFSNANLENVNLSGVDFTNADLSNTVIHQSILIGANLTDEQLKQVKSITCTVMPDGNFNTDGC